MKFKSNISNSQEGFTLVELLVVLPIIIVTGFFLAYLVSYEYRVYSTQSAELAIAADARLSLDEIDIYVRQANRVASNYSTYVTDSQTLVLQLQSVDASGQVVSGAYDYAVFYLSGTTLKGQIFPDASSSRVAATKTLANNIDTSNFSFTYDNASYGLARNVETNLALQQNAGGYARSISVSSSATLRNY